MDGSVNGLKWAISGRESQEPLSTFLYGVKVGRRVITMNSCFIFTIIIHGIRDRHNNPITLDELLLCTF